MVRIINEAKKMSRTANAKDVLENITYIQTNLKELALSIKSRDCKLKPIPEEIVPQIHKLRSLLNEILMDYNYHIR